MFTFLLGSIWDLTWEVAGAIIPVWLLVVLAGGIGVVAVFGVIAGVISTKYRKKHKLGKYAPAPDRAVKLKLDEKAEDDASAQQEQVPAQETPAPAQEESRIEESQEGTISDEQPKEAQSAKPTSDEGPAEEQTEQPAPQEEELIDDETIEGQIAKTTVFEQDTTREELLASMTDTTSLSEFDFDGDFDEWEEVTEVPQNDSIDSIDEEELDFDEFEPVQEGESAWEPAQEEETPREDAPVEDEEALQEEPVEEEEDELDSDVWVADEVEDPDADLETNVWVAGEFDLDEDEEEGKAGPRGEVPKYLRSFRSRLIQALPRVKNYYSVIKNELLSYKKMRSSESWNAESFLLGRKTYAKMMVVGKTLCVFLALNPAEFDPKTFHHRDKSGIKKYEATPLLMRVTSEQAVRRTVSLIATMAYDNGFTKGGEQTVDYAAELEYKTDEELLAASLIKHNLKAVDQVEVEDEPQPAYRSVAMVSKKQLGNLTDEDIAKLHQKAEDSKKVKGKFVVTSEDGVFRFTQYAGEKALFVSGGFRTQAMAIKGVSAYKKVLADPNTTVKYCSVDGQFFYILKSTRNWVSVMYPTKDACVKGYETAKAAIADSTISAE